MLKEERLKYIISQINIHNKVLSADLSTKLCVSEDTVRRDLNELTDNGQIIKVHGGAISKSFHSPYSERDVYKKDEKKEIARKAVDLIEDGMLVIAGGGTTMIEQSAPKLKAPRNSCDCHIHVYDASFPTAPTATILPPPLCTVANRPG